MRCRLRGEPRSQLAGFARFRERWLRFSAVRRLNREIELARYAGIVFRDGAVGGMPSSHRLRQPEHQK